MSKKKKGNDGKFIPLNWEDVYDVQYVRGHVTKEEGQAAFIKYNRSEAERFPVLDIKHRWARWIPRRNEDFDRVLAVRDEKGRGMFAVTELQLTEGGAA